MTIRIADWRALGTGVRLVVLDGDLDAARRAVEDILADVDLALSRFRPDSELMALNAAAGRTNVVGPLLARAIEGALAAARRSHGAFDPTVGRALRVMGYDADFDTLVARGATPIELRIAPVAGWQSVALDRVRSTVRVPTGVELDLGSTGKGLAADLAAAAAHDAAGPDAGLLVSLGGDIATAGRAPDGGWRIQIAEDHATDPAGPLAQGAETVSIAAGAVATSSITVRRWQAASGVTVHHIVDPRTGLHALTPWRTVTVAAATAEEANGASTAAIVLAEAGPAWLERIGLPARLVGTDGHVLRVNGWPAPEQRAPIAA